MTDLTMPVGADGTAGSHSARGWVFSLLLLAVGVVYISGFWGRAAAYLPVPLDHWWLFNRKLLNPWWHAHVLTSLSASQRGWLLWVALGMIAPASVLVLCRRRLTDVGIGLPNVLGWRLVIISVLVSIPFGLWLIGVSPAPKSGRQPVRSQDAFLLLLMIPEHFLICGTYVALMLPGRRLPNPVPIAPVEGPMIVRALRWVGLAQPPVPWMNRSLAWFGLTWASLFAITASGALFWMAHVGKPHRLEVILSLPGGVAVAYVTLRSRSIWPAILAHWSMNLIPTGLLVLLR